MRERDSQRSKVYRAESDAATRGGSFETIPEIEAYLERVFSHEWFKRHHPHALRFLVKDGRGRRKACGGAQGLCVVMSMPKWFRTEDVVLHELAHGLVELKWGRGTAWHGWEFCKTLLELVRHYIDAESADNLRLSFKEHRVRYCKPKRGRKLTPEQREVAISRLVSAREAKAAKTRME
jgi:putative metallohydrolase (TIGR04338 family)